jgi:uncharacterized protein YfaP (DUF2135 family)
MKSQNSRWNPGKGIEMRSSLLACSALFLFVALFSVSMAQDVRIDSPRSGFTTERLQTISGRVSNFSGNRAELILNGVAQSVPLLSGRFNIKAVVSPGNNLVEARAGKGRDRVSFFARVPARDVKIVLIWDTPTDVDLWVIDPEGEKCYYAHRSTSSGGNLDVDVIDGYGPETFTLARARPGSYSVQAQYYSSNNSPVTRVQVYVVKYEGQSREEIRRYNFVMTREHEVYDIARFTIDPET